MSSFLKAASTLFVSAVLAAGSLIGFTGTASAAGYCTGPSAAGHSVMKQNEVLCTNQTMTSGAYSLQVLANGSVNLYRNRTSTKAQKLCWSWGTFGAGSFLRAVLVATKAPFVEVRDPHFNQVRNQTATTPNPNSMVYITSNGVLMFGHSAAAFADGSNVSKPCS